jgi:hypothetical protein
MKQKDVILCDLDGTLANCDHRRHHVESKPKNRDAFYAGVSDDEYNPPVLTLLKSMQEGTPDGANICDIWFVTGRPERCREDTVRWLHDTCGFSKKGYDYLLYMRKDGDYRADYIVKQEILDTHIDRERVLFVLDDRQQVVDMWRRNGLTCFQVAPGNF